MTDEANGNEPGLSNRRADLTARIDRAREALNIADRNELEAAQVAATMRGLATIKGSRRERRQAGRNAQNFETKVAKSRAVVRASANAVLIILQGELDALPRPDDGAP